MHTQQVFSASAAAVLIFGIAGSAQTTGQRKVDTPETQVTLVGCIQREADYRRANDAGKGGPLGSGLRLGNEFVLVTSPGGEGDCATARTGDAYELTGNRERELEGFVGRRVEITGMQKEAEPAAGGRLGGDRGTGPELSKRGGSFSELRPRRRAGAGASGSRVELTTALAPPGRRRPCPAPRVRCIAGMIGCFIRRALGSAHCVVAMNHLKRCSLREALANRVRRRDVTTYSPRPGEQSRVVTACA